MRIVSLLPAATEWVCALGGEADLVGRSHACNHPTSVQRLPVLTRPAFSGSGDAAVIDTAVRDRLRKGLSLFDVDLERLLALEPDLILTQAQCAVCAVSLPELEQALGSRGAGKPRLLSLEPVTLKQVLDGALCIGRAMGGMEEAMPFIAGAERRLHLLRERLGLRRDTPEEERPAVVCVEWMEPLMTAGHWVPDLVELAGGRAVGAEGGAPSRYTSWAALLEADPDVLVVAPCGFTLEETRRNLHYLTGRPGWERLRAVRQGRVYLFDGEAYFNRPGPRLYRSIELLAAALHPGRLPAEPLQVRAWEMGLLRAGEF